VKGCWEYDNRSFCTLEEMHSVIMKNWNDTITNGDTVYILEDISMRGTNGERIASVEKLKRQKVLIKGNHDKVSNFRYKLVFSWNGMNRGIVLLYEHVHEVAEDTYF
jgi:Predicted phosphoesterase or phosphohydrolase